MDFPNRLQLERSVTLALARASARHRRELLGYLGDPPDARRVPEDFWRRVEEDQQTVLVAWLAWLFAANAVRHGGDATQALAQGQQWAAARAGDVARVYTVTSRDRTGNAADGAGATEVRRRVLDGVFGPTRDAGIGTTETTKASSSGAEWAIHATGREAEGDRWRTERDASVCPVCRPLHGTPRSVWSREFEFGPPAHPNCRCDIVYAASAGPIPPDFPEPPG